MLVHLLTVGNKRTSILLTELQAYKFRAESSGTAKIIGVKVHNVGWPVTVMPQVYYFFTPVHVRT